MNERIKLLAEQAEQHANEQNDKHGVRFKSEYDRKFAELIVKECGVALNPMLRDMVSRGQAFDLIKRHFGVEE